LSLRAGYGAHMTTLARFCAEAGLSSETAEIITRGAALDTLPGLECVCCDDVLKGWEAAYERDWSVDAARDAEEDHEVYDEICARRAAGIDVTREMRQFLGGDRAKRNLRQVQLGRGPWYDN
jgi:hypothetical protein